MRIHVGQGLPSTPGWKLLVPQRDPGNVWLSHHYRHQGRDYPDGKPRSDDVLGMYEELEEWCTRFPSISYPVDTPVLPTYWGKLAQFLEVPSEAMFSGDVLSFVHAGHKYGAAVQITHRDAAYTRSRVPSTDRYSNVELPEWVKTLRTECGYTEPFNPAGYVATPLVEGYGPTAPTIPAIR